MFMRLNLVGTICAILFVSTACSPKTYEVAEVDKSVQSIPPNLCSSETKRSELIEKIVHIELWRTTRQSEDPQRYAVFDRAGECIYEFEHIPQIGKSGEVGFRIPHLTSAREATAPPVYVMVEGMSFRHFAGTDELAEAIILELKASCKSKILADPACFEFVDDWIDRNVAGVHFSSAAKYHPTSDHWIDVIGKRVFFMGSEIDDKLRNSAGS